MCIMCCDVTRSGVPRGSCTSDEDYGSKKCFLAWVGSRDQCTRSPQEIDDLVTEAWSAAVSAKGLPHMAARAHNHDGKKRQTKDQYGYMVKKTSARVDL